MVCVVKCNFFLSQETYKERENYTGPPPKAGVTVFFGMKVTVNCDTGIAAFFNDDTPHTKGENSLPTPQKTKQI